MMQGYYAARRHARRQVWWDSKRKKRARGRRGPALSPTEKECLIFLAVAPVGFLVAWPYVYLKQGRIFMALLPYGIIAGLLLWHAVS